MFLQYVFPILNAQICCKNSANKNTANKNKTAVLWEFWKMFKNSSNLFPE